MGPHGPHSHAQAVAIQDSNTFAECLPDQESITNPDDEPIAEAIKDTISTSYAQCVALGHSVTKPHTVSVGSAFAFAQRITDGGTECDG